MVLHPPRPSFERKSRSRRGEPNFLSRKAWRRSVGKEINDSDVMIGRFKARLEAYYA